MRGIAILVSAAAAAVLAVGRADTLHRFLQNQEIQPIRLLFAAAALGTAARIIRRLTGRAR